MLSLKNKKEHLKDLQLLTAHGVHFVTDKEERV